MGTTLVVLGVLAARGGPRPTTEQAAAPTPAAEQATAPSAGTTPPRSGPTPRAAAPPPAPPATDLDPSAAAESATTTAPGIPTGGCDVGACTTVAAGGTVTHDGRRFALGTDADEVSVADWDCDGTPTPLLVRPATGEVFAVPRWPVADEDVAAERVAALGPGTHLTPSPLDLDGCAAAIVVAPDGAVFALPLAAPPPAVRPPEASP